MDGEVGRFEFETYRVKDADGVVDRARIFPSLTGQEWYRTAGFKELGYGYGSINGSYRHTTSWLNQLRHQQEAETPGRTL